MLAAAKPHNVTGTKMHVGVGIDMFGTCVQAAKECVSGFVGVSTLLSLLSVVPQSETHARTMRALQQWLMVDDAAHDVVQASA